ncbi:MAG: dihydropteroate synthase [bacterium]|nr:dihydropteroate synthase [bacterium]
MMTIIGERINMTRKSIREKVWERDAAFVTAEVQRQEACGATHIDINAGADPAREIEDMRWLTEVVSSATQLPLSFDSARAEVLRAGLELCNRPGTIINSTTAESARLADTLPLVKEFNTGIIALTMDDGGMAETIEDRQRIIDALCARMREEGIGLERVYIDPLVRPVSTNPEQALMTIAGVRYVKTRYPEAHTMVGLSNVSYGLPSRIHVNRAFFALLVEAGLDGAIIDPTAEGMMGIMLATRALTGQDEFCMEYIAAARAGKI